MVSARKKVEARVEALMDCMMETEDERSRSIINRMVKVENESPDLDERSYLFGEVCSEMYPVEDAFVVVSCAYGANYSSNVISVAL